MKHLFAAVLIALFVAGCAPAAYHPAPNDQGSVGHTDSGGGDGGGGGSM